MMTTFKRKSVSFWLTISLHIILLTIHIEAVERKVACRNSRKNDQHINEVYYDRDANSPNDDCDDSVSQTAVTIDQTKEGNTNILVPSHKVTTKTIDTDDPSIRKARSEQTDAIVPSAVLQFDPKHSTDVVENRQNNPNGDIQDIITGIVKLLNGNVNVHANTQFPPPTTRRHASRINNRGPPRIQSEVPISLSGIDDKFTILPKTTPYPTGIRKPPMVPYPFDLPPEKPLRNEHPVLVHNMPVLNRPPWHGSRTRPPVQISNTNRLQLPTRVSMNIPPSMPSQDLRPPSNSVNPMTAYNTRIPEITKPTENYPNEQYIEAITNPHIQAEQSKEITKKTDIPKKPTRIQSPIAASIDDTTKIITETTTTPTISATPTTSTFDEPTKTSAPVTEISQPSAILDEYTRTPPLSKIPTTTTHDRTTLETTNNLVQSTTKSTILPSRVSKPSQNIEPTDIRSYYGRPGIVLDDTDYKPGALEPSTQATFHHVHKSTPVQSAASLSNIYAEIFDVTLSAIQGQPAHNKVVDLLEIRNTATDDGISATRVIGADGNDIIVTASDDNSFVSIDGKRTYINLFGETEQLKKPLKTHNEYQIYQQSTKTVTPYAEKTNSIPANRNKPALMNKPTNQTAGPQLPLSMRYNYRPKPQQNAVRIDTCIVGDDSTCDMAQNEICKTDLGVSSCHCRPGYSRRKYRDPCRRVVSLIMSMRVDKYYEKPIVWDKILADNNSDQFEQMNYETMRAVDSVMSMTPFSDDFISARVHNIYSGNASQGTPGVFVNMTIQMDGNTESARNYIQSNLQKQLIAVIHRRNNNIGNSALYVDQPAGSISNLQDFDECSSVELNDCHANANCTNNWGAFQCKCAPGFRDPWSDQPQRAGRECVSCSNSYCNNRGTCQYDESGTQLIFSCLNSYYGSQCEIDGEILTVSVGASIIAVLIITLTLICLVMWGRRWNQEQKEMVGSPIFNYISRANLDSHIKTMQSKTYQAALEDRMRWAQIADVMAQSNHYAVEPTPAQRQPAPLYVYQNMHHPNGNPNLTSLSMAGTLPVRSRMGDLPMPISRMDMESKMRRHEHTSSSEEDDLVDLLGETYQSPTGIYYDVDCESSDQQHGTSTLQSNLESGGPLYSLSNAPRVPMSTYTPNPRMYSRN